MSEIESMTKQPDDRKQKNGCPTEAGFTAHESDSILAGPLTHLLRQILHDFRGGWDLAWVLLQRNIRTQYRQTMLGYAWIIIPQLATVGAMVLLARTGVIDTGINKNGYELYVLVGTLLWQAFFDGFASPLKVVRSSMAMLASVRFPREALILAGIGEVLWSFYVRFFVALGLMLLLGWTPGWAFCFFPLGVLALILFGWMLGMLLIPVGILFKDIEYGMGIIGLLWFIITPVAYTVPRHPSWIMQWNPLTPMLELNRSLILGGSSVKGASILWVALALCALALLSAILFRIAMPHLIKRLPD